LAIENLLAQNCGYTIDEAKELIKKSVHVAQMARNDSVNKDVLIAGSVGPYGATKCDGSEFSGLYANEMSIEVNLIIFKIYFMNSK
jgi:S-methylmethionine-dependent homocysteine/selenocysteine methylase